MPRPKHQYDAKTHQSQTATIRVSGDVVFVTSQPDAETEDIRGWLDVIKELSIEAPFVVWDARETSSLAKDDRACAVDAVGRVIAGLAVVAGSPVPPRVVDLYVTLQRMDLPIALFESEAQALDWISSLGPPSAA